MRPSADDFAGALDAASRARRAEGAEGADDRELNATLPRWVTVLVVILLLVFVFVVFGG